MKVQKKLCFLIVLFFVSATYNLENAPKEKEELVFKFVHITDTHCTSTKIKKNPPFFSSFQIGPYRKHWQNLFYSFPILKKTIEFINKGIKPAFLIHTGDITQNGNLKDLKQSKTILDNCNFPYYTVMGDHDGIKTNNFEKVFGKRCYSFNYKNWHFIIIGIFPTDKEIKWFKKDLKENSEKPIIIATHRLIICDKFTEFLAKKFINVDLLMPKAEEVLTIIKKYPNIKLFLSGHVHTNLHYKKYGIHFISTSALCEPPYQFRTFEIYKDRIIVKTFIAENIKKVLNKKWRIFHKESIQICH